jgi:hypothetical protein
MIMDLLTFKQQDLDLPLLDKEKVYENYSVPNTNYQVTNSYLGIFGFVFTFIRENTVNRC